MAEKMTAFGFEFDFASGADALLGGLTSLGKSLIGNGSSEAAKAKIEAATRVNAANDQIKAARSSLAEHIRSLNNQRIMEAAGEKANALSQALSRTAEAFTAGNFERGIRLAEQLGATQAQAAASGTGGSSIQHLSQVQIGQQARLAQASAEQYGARHYDLLTARTGAVTQGIQSLTVAGSPSGVGLGGTSLPDFKGQGSTFSALLEGLLGKKDSIQTFLGSIKGAGEGSGDAVAFPVDRAYQADFNFQYGADLRSSDAGTLGVPNIDLNLGRT